MGVLPHHDRWADVLATSASSSSTKLRLPRCLRFARRRTCCGGSAAGAIYGAGRGSCSPPRRSRTPSSSEATSSAAGDRDRRRLGTAGRAYGRPSGSAVAQRGTGTARLGARGGGEAQAGRGARVAHADFREETEGRRADPSFHRRRLGDDSQLGRIAPGTRRSSGVRSSGGSAKASCSACRDERARARDRRRPARRGDLGRLPGTVASLRQRGAARDGAATGSRCSSHPRMGSTSTSCATRLAVRLASKRHCSIPRPRGSPPDMSAGRVRGAHDEPDAEILGPDALAAAAADDWLRHTTKAGFVLGGEGLSAARVAALGRTGGVPVVDASTARCSARPSARAPTRPCMTGRSPSYWQPYLVHELDENPCARSSSRSAATRTCTPSTETQNRDRAAASRRAAHGAWPRVRREPQRRSSRSGRTISVCVSFFACVYQSPRNGSTIARIAGLVELVHEVRLAEVEVDRALVHGRVRARALDEPEHRAGRGVDDRERVRLGRPQRRRAPPGSPSRPRRSPRGVRRSSGSAAAASSASGPRISTSPSSSGASNAAARTCPARMRGFAWSSSAASTRRPSSLSGSRMKYWSSASSPATSTASPWPRRPARPHCWRSDATVPGKADRDHGVEQADVDPELERVRRRHAEQVALAEPPLDLAPLRRRVSRRGTARAASRRRAARP